jgi:hypothetical protein
VKYVPQASRDRQSVIPTTVKQLLSTITDPSSDAFKLDNAELFIVKLVGTVQQVEEHSTNFSYRLNDGTGVIECKYWIEKDSGASGSKHMKCRYYIETLTRTLSNILKQRIRLCFTGRKSARI